MGAHTVSIPFSALDTMVQVYGSWLYSGNTCSVIEAERRIYIRVTLNTLEMALKSSVILVKQMFKVPTYSLENPNDVWEFVLDYAEIKGILENFRKLSCTYIDSITFTELEEPANTVEMILHEVPKEGYPEDYKQDQKYLYKQKGTVNFDRVYYDIKNPEVQTPVDMQGLNDFMGILTPRLLDSKSSNPKLSIDQGYGMTEDLNCIYTLKNPVTNILPNDIFLGKEQSSVLRNFAKYHRNSAVTGGYTDDVLALYVDNLVIYISKADLDDSKFSYTISKGYDWCIEVESSYFKDMLQRFSKIPEIEMTIYTDTGRAYFTAHGIKQHMSLKSFTDTANNVKIIFKPSVLMGMLLRVNGVLRLRFTAKKSRGKTNYYICHMDNGDYSDWTALVYVRKGV